MHPAHANKHVYTRNDEEIISLPMHAADYDALFRSSSRSPVLGPSTAEHVDDAVVALVAGVLIQGTLRYAARRLIGRQLNTNAPRSRELQGIGQGEFVLERVGVDAREAFDQAHGLGWHAPGGRPSVVGLVREVR